MARRADRDRNPSAGLSAEPSHDAARRRFARLAHLLDDRFRVPGTSWRFGLDGLLGLVPGIGDAATTALGAYIILEAWRRDAPKATLGRMIANTGIDFAIGAIPIVGDLFDFGWKANRRNVELLLRHLDRWEASDRAARRGPGTG
ncbi:MAG TPA: DUF4112 domain-containing protein [Xanthobacteraceae bacterium]|nr:DUF4112 domain-containing protein [Xanthobacteraceae bacterium]